VVANPIGEDRFLEWSNLILNFLIIMEKRLKLPWLTWLN